MEEKLTIEDLGQILKERLLLIMVLTSLSIFLGAILSYFVLDSSYEASTQILVNQKQSDVIQIDNQTIQTDLQLINTYSVIIKSPAILDKVITLSGQNLTADELNEKVTVESSEDSQVFKIRVRDGNLETAVLIANNTAQVFESEIREIMEVNNISILTPAVVKVDQKPIQPTPLLNIALAGVIGLLLGVGIAFLLSYLDNTLKSEESIKEYLKILVIGIISTTSDIENASAAIPQDLNRKEA